MSDSVKICREARNRVSRMTGEEKEMLLAKGLDIINQNQIDQTLGYTTDPGFPYTFATSTKIMKKTIALIIGLVLCVGVSHAQTTNTTPPASFWGGIGEAGQAFVNIFKSDTNALGSTTWVAIPFASYDVSQKQFGGGIALIYPVENTPLFVGARLENINGTWTTPSIQVQLKKTITVSGFSITPYGVGGTAIVNGDVAAYVGVGAYIDLYDFTIKGHAAALGVTGDYETWGGLPSPCGTKRVNFGLCGKISF